MFKFLTENFTQIHLVGATMIHENRLKFRHDRANRQFSQIKTHAYKIIPLALMTPGIRKLNWLQDENSNSMHQSF
jgi:hypothetical protein